MDIDEGLFRQAQLAFNSIKILKGQITNMATCDSQGRPDVAPIGSMRVTDAHTVHVLQGLLPRTMKNLESNPQAAFSVTLLPTFGTLASMLRAASQRPSGYRIYGELVGIEDEQTAIQGEIREIVQRMPRLLRGPFTRFCNKTLRRLLKFRILEIRPT